MNKFEIRFMILVVRILKTMLFLLWYEREEMEMSDSKAKERIRDLQYDSYCFITDLEKEEDNAE